MYKIKIMHKKNYNKILLRILFYFYDSFYRFKFNSGD